MCREAKPIRSVVLFEGQVNWIMERETDEERLAAWETLIALAFPTEENKFEPPAKATKGNALTPCERVKRDVYNLFKDVIESRASKGGGKAKDIKKVEAGKLGAAVRYATGRGESSTSSTDIETSEQRGIIERDDGTPQDVIYDDFQRDVAGEYKYNQKLTSEEKEIIKKWDATIPNAGALREYLEKNYFYQNRKTILKLEFCEFAFHKLAKIDRWISTKNKRPLRDIRQAIHYIALDYIKKEGEIRRITEEERRKDIASEFETKTTIYGQQTASDLATIERKRRRAAEKKAMDKIIKGEL